LLRRNQSRSAITCIAGNDIAAGKIDCAWDDIAVIATSKEIAYSAGPAKFSIVKISSRSRTNEFWGWAVV
jgi:hypothetical protein